MSSFEGKNTPKMLHINAMYMGHNRLVEWTLLMATEADGTNAWETLFMQVSQLTAVQSAH